MINIFPISISHAWKDVDSIPSCVVFIGRLFTYIVTFGYFGFPRAKSAQMDRGIDSGKLMIERMVSQEEEVQLTIAGNTCEEFVENYRELLYDRQSVFFKFKTLFLYKLGDYELKKGKKQIYEGYFLKNGKQNKERICVATYDRFMKIGILQEQEHFDERHVVDMSMILLAKGPFTINDKFNLMLKDEKLEEKLRKIPEIVESLLEAEKAFNEHLKKLVIAHQDNPTRLTSLINFMKADAINDPYMPNRIKYQKHSKRRVTGPSPNTDLPWLKESLKTNTEKIISAMLERNVWTWNQLCAMTSMYPCKLMAYLWFEIFINYACRPYRIESSLKEHFGETVKAHEDFVKATFVKCFGLLRSDAEEVAKLFKLDLANDRLLREVDGLESVVAKTIDEEIDIYDCYKTEAEESERRDNNRQKNNKGEKKIGLQERNTMIVFKHKIKLEEEEKAKQARRMERIKKLHDLPSAEFVETRIVNCLEQGKGKNGTFFYMVFGIEDNDRTMNHYNMLNLAKCVCDILRKNNIGCADDLLNEVKARTHFRHKDGNALPEHYVDILRSAFVTFGIFPKAWEPKTTEDFDARNKYIQRCDDKNFFEIREKVGKSG